MDLELRSTLRMTTEQHTIRQLWNWNEWKIRTGKTDSIYICVNTIPVAHRQHGHSIAPALT